jgi:hypothetical protein
LVHYSIIGDTFGFIIDQDTGMVKVNDSSFLDREITSELMLTIQAKDEAPPGLTKSSVVLVSHFSIYFLKIECSLIFLIFNRD